MTAWLIRTFIHNASAVEDPDVRAAYGTFWSICCCPAQSSWWVCSAGP